MRSSLGYHRQIIGIIACLERFLVDADEAGNVFLLHLLEKQRMRLKGLFDRHVVSFLSLLGSSIIDTQLSFLE